MVDRNPTLEWRKLNVCSSNSALVCFWLGFAHFFWNATVPAVHFIKDSLFPGKPRYRAIKVPDSLTKYVGWSLHLDYNSLAVTFILWHIWINIQKALSFGSKFWQCKIADMCTPVASEHLNSTHLSNSYSNQLFYLAEKLFILEKSCFDVGNCGGCEAALLLLT